MFVFKQACFDVREAVVFWGIMRTLTELKIEKDIPPILSTHPDHGDREKHLNELMPNAIALRNNVGASIAVIFNFFLIISFEFINY